MRRYGEIRVVRGQDDALLQMARDLLGMLACIGFMVLILFLAGGM